jgi:metal-responsive CopG/Arc/MetJ family transcriptional regulator
MKMVSLRLDESTQNQLNLLAQQKNMSKSKIIKDALAYYFDMTKKESKEKTPYELGSELFGKYSSGNDDLSTTYKQKIKDKINAKLTNSGFTQ